MTTTEAGPPINSADYWDGRFQTDWEERGGPDQTRFFARIALQMIPDWLLEDIRSNATTIMDFGCAEGDAVPILSSGFQTAAVEGCDFAQSAVDIAATRYSDFKFHRAIDGRLPKPVDVIFCSNTIEHLADWREHLDKLSAQARRHVIILAPFDEIPIREPEHVTSFTFGTLPASIGGIFKLTYHAVLSTTEITGSRWVGHQFLAVWSSPEALATIGTAGGDTSIESLDAMDMRTIPVEAIPYCFQLANAAHYERARASEAQTAARQAQEAEKLRLTSDISSLNKEIDQLNAKLTASDTASQAAENEKQRLYAAVEQHNANLAAKEQALQASFDALRQHYTAITSMNSFRYMMRVLERYGRLRGVRIARPPASERIRVRIERFDPSNTDGRSQIATRSALQLDGLNENIASAAAKSSRAGPCVLIQASSLDRGGVEQVVYDQAKGLEALGKRAVVLVTGRGGDIASRLAAGGTEVEVLGAYDQEAYAAVIEKLPIELTITHYAYDGLPLLKMRDIPIIDVVHNYYHWCQHDIAAFRSAAAPATHRVAVSSGVADFHADVFGYARQNIHVIPNPINREGLVRPERMMLEAARASHRKVFNFINVAQFFPAKAQLMLLEAFAAVHSEFDHARLTLLGSYSDQQVYEELRRSIDEHDLGSAVAMPGFVDRRELSRQLAFSHVFVQPSVYEGYSVAMTEAAHFALPMILTRIGGAIDVVQNSDCGILIPPHAETLKGVKETAVFDLGMRRKPHNLPHLIDAMRNMLVDYETWAQKGYVGQSRIDAHSIERFCKSYLDIAQIKTASAA